MEDNRTDSAHLEPKLVGDITGTFRVPRYQRGYRWTKLEIDQLLNDLRDNGDKDYSLQPVVVKQDAGDVWELVDGQQRLTTLYLIFLYMQRAGLKNVSPPYSLKYDTRPKSEDYLQDPSSSLANDNIDFFHLHAAYTCIQAWFEAKGQSPIKLQAVADDVFRYLCNRVRVIWYEAPKGLDSTELFRRLNVGRIPLTDAELFKALLLARSHGGEGKADRRHEIAAQWDGIERDLQHPDVWAFVADTSVSNTPTRITLLLDTVAGDPSGGGTRPPFYTFDVLREKVESAGPEEIWNHVVELHARVLGWYENRDHYHKIGYLVMQGTRFRDLVSIAAGKTKSELKAALDERIRHTLNLSPSEVCALSYNDEADRKKLERVLLLMNVETVQRVHDSTERYSFRSHRSQAWSLEHIHAQHAEGLTTAVQWNEWLRLHRAALADLPSVDTTTTTTKSDLLRRIDDVGNKLDRQAFQALANDIAKVFTSADVSNSVDSVSNLALLARDHNSALSNAVFEVKRRRILELDRQGAYIPICTRHAFLKYYTDADAHQVHFWSTQDRDAYLRAILSTSGGVGAYLNPEDSASS